MKYLIVGRTGSGKNYLTDKLSELGLKRLKSYTTRPKRFENEDTYTFITPEESAEIENKFAHTEIDGYEYFSTPEMVLENDMYIVDPKGVFEVADKMPNETFHLIYIWADKLERRIHAVKRASDPIKEEKKFESRDNDENESFTDFEKMLQDDGADCLPPNITTVYSIENTYEDEAFDISIKRMQDHMKVRDNIIKITEYFVKAHVLNENSDGFIVNAVKSSTDDQPKDISKERYADVILHDTETFAAFVEKYLSEVEL